MITTAMFNNKGGVGKTTLLCNLAAYLALEENKRVLIIDTDPQCNATQILFDEGELEDIYTDSDRSTIYSFVQHMSFGIGYAESPQRKRSENFGVDVILGDPDLAMVEDLLAKDWSNGLTGEVRSLRTTFLFRELVKQCSQYDYVFFDMSPSLGAINRSVLLASDYFISPMSTDIFSLKAMQNIQRSLENWRTSLALGIERVNPNALHHIPAHKMGIKFAGYVTQQYITTTQNGKKRPVKAYERIMEQIPHIVCKSFGAFMLPHTQNIDDYNLGSIPNLFSLIPISQYSHKPVFTLRAKDGVTGVNHRKVKEAKDVYRGIADSFQNNTALAQKGGEKEREAEELFF